MPFCHLGEVLNGQPFRTCTPAMLVLYRLDFLEFFIELQS